MYNFFQGKYGFILLVVIAPYVLANEDPVNLETIALTADGKKAIQDAYKGGGNMDIPRTENDIQPYTIINSETIQQSGATSVEEVLNKVLTMNTSVQNEAGTGFTATTSQVNLRGLGANHTLILINGRRSAGIGNRGTAELSDQPNLNNIPLSAIERIEVLPTSASAIYGSSAIGGVINIILKRDYVGTEITVRYQDTFDNNQPVKNFSLLSGFSLEDGRTQVMITASREDQDALTHWDKKWRNMGRALQLKNNPNSILGATNPPAGNLVNIKSKNGTDLIPGSSMVHIPKGWNGDLSQLQSGYALGLSNAMSAWSGDTSVITESETESYGLSVNRDFTDKLNIYAEAGYDQETAKHLTAPHGYGSVEYKANNPANPFGQDVLVTYPVNWSDMGIKAYRRPENKTTRFGTGFTYNLNPDWTINADYAWSRANIMIHYPRRGSNNPGAKAWTNDFNNGLIDLIQDTTTNGTDVIAKYWNYAKTKSQSTLNDFALRAAGTAYRWYAGDINLATGLEYRKIETEGFADHQHVDNPWRKPTERSMNASSAYAELSIPFISPDMNLSWAKHFDMQIAGRYERFDVKARTPLYKVDTVTQYNSVLTGYDVQDKVTYDDFTPTVGFSFAPNDQLMLRASYSEGFITPELNRLAEPTSSEVTTGTLTDPKTGQVIQTYSSLGGGNPDLTPESSKSYNAGIVFTPNAISGLRLSLDYFNIKKSNNILAPSAQDILNNEDRFVGRVQRDANGNVIAIDTKPFNALGLKTQGLDANLSYNFDSKIGHSIFKLGYTYTDRYDEQNTLAGDWESKLNGSASGNPIRHRANASFVLQPTDQWSFGWASQYYDGYNITDKNAILSQTGQALDKYKIDDAFFHDIFARYKLKVPKMKDTSAEFTLGINNLFDEYTLDMTGTNYISRFSNTLGRHYYVNMKFAF